MEHVKKLSANHFVGLASILQGLPGLNNTLKSCLILCVSPIKSYVSSKKMGGTEVTKNDVDVCKAGGGAQNNIAKRVNIYLFCLGQLSLKMSKSKKEKNIFTPGVAPPQEEVEELPRRYADEEGVETTNIKGAQIRSGRASGWPRHCRRRRVHIQGGDSWQ